MMTGSGNLLEWMARLGFGARGVVYCLIGGLAVLAAFGSGGQVGGSRSALQTLLGEPFGQVLLGIIALGLFCFATWRIVEAVTDADHLGSSGKALATRGGHALGGIVYGALGVSTVGLILGQRSNQGDDQSARDWTAWLLAQPFGQWLVGLIGLAFIVSGLAFLKKGWSGNVAANLALSSEARRWVVPLGRLGHMARGVVFALIGVFLVLAAVHSSSAEAKGLGGALQSLQAQPYGWLLLGITAAGLFAFGVFALVQALYRHIDSPDVDHLKDAAVQGLRH